MFPGVKQLLARVELEEIIHRVSGTAQAVEMQAQAAGSRESAKACSLTVVQLSAVTVVLESKVDITTLHSDAEAFITTIVIITLPAGYSTGYPGQIVVVPFVIPGVLAIHSVFSGRFITANSSS